MQNFQDTFEIRKPSFIIAFLVWMTVCFFKSFKLYVSAFVYLVVSLFQRRAPHDNIANFVSLRFSLGSL